MMPACIVRDESVGAHLIVVLAAGHIRACEPGAELDSLHRPDAEHRVGELRVELVEDRFAETGIDAG